MKADEPKLLRISNAAHELGLHPFTARKWIKQGKIASFSGRLYGMRSHQQKELVKCAQAVINNP